jgi:hypothetical protein
MKSVRGNTEGEEEDVGRKTKDERRKTNIQTVTSIFYPIIPNPDTHEYIHDSTSPAFRKTPQ